MMTRVADGPTQRIPAESMHYLVRRPGPQPSAQAQALHRPVFIAFLVCLAVFWVLLAIGAELPKPWQWTEGLLYVAAAATTLISLARRLPVQNVASSGMIIACVSAVVVAFAAKTRVPFGHFEFKEGWGPKVLDYLAWPVPFLWITLILNSRGTARLILRPLRRDRHYGRWLMGSSVLLTLALVLLLEPFGVKVKSYWEWKVQTTFWDWYGAPWSNFVAWAAVTLLIVAFSTPWMIHKRSYPQHAEFHPVVMWISLALYFATGCAVKAIWAPVLFGVAASALVALLAWRNGRQTPPAGPPSPAPPSPAPTPVNQGAGRPGASPTSAA
jgi:uncharacterized membrane protein